MSLIVSSGQVFHVSGTVDNGDQVQAGGLEIIDLGATASNTLISGFFVTSPLQFDFAVQEVLGSAANTLITAGGAQVVFDGGVSSETTIIGPGAQVLSGGTAFATMIWSGGVQAVDQGVASGAQVFASGQQNIGGGGAGAIADNTAIFSGGTQVISSGGAAFGTVVSEGGSETVLSGGLAFGTTLTGVPGSFQTVALQVVSGGSADFTAIEEGGYQEVYAGGAASQTLISGVGGQLVGVGGTAFDTTISSGGNQYVAGGGVASGTTVVGLAQQTVSGGTAFATTLSSGGKQFLGGGGSAFGAQISAGGTETVDSGGAAFGTTVSAGGFQTIFTEGTASGTVLSGSTESIATLGFQLISGGSAVDTTVDSGGIQILFSGTASGTILNVSGEQQLSGGTAFATSISGGAQQVLSGAVASDTTIVAGDQFVSGGSVFGTVLSGGTQELLSGGLGFGTTVSGGFEAIGGGGVASATVVDSGGLVVVGSGGELDAPVLSGGTAALGGGATDNGGLTFGAGGSLLVLDPGAVVNGTVSATGSTANTLELAVGDGSIGTIAGLGSQFGGYNSLVVDPGAIWELNGTVGSSVTLTNNGTISETGSDNLTINGALQGTGVIVLDPTTTAINGAVSGQTFHLVGAGDTLQLGDPSEFGGTIDGLASSGGTLDFTGYTVTDASVDPSGTLTLTTNSGPITLQLGDPGTFSGEFFHFNSDGGSGTSITVDSTACYCPGTLIRTERGEVAVEDLKIGDRLITVTGAVAPIQWIGRRSYAGRFLAGQKHILPIRIRAGALGDQVPRRDLWISPQHAMYLDGVLVEAKDLVNGVSIVQEHVEQVDYVHIELEAHDVIWAEGAASETFIDDDSRWMFQNAEEFAQLYPGLPWKPAEYCAPRLNEGYALEAIRQRLAERAAMPQIRPAAGAARLRQSVGS